MDSELLIELGTASEETMCSGVGECGDSIAGPFIFADGLYTPTGEPCDS